MKIVAIYSWIVVLFAVLLVLADKPKAAAPLWVIGISLQFVIGGWFLYRRFVKRT